MPMQDYSLKERLFGNFIVSSIMGLGTIFIFVVVSALMKIDLNTQFAPFLIPSYFVLITFFSETKLRKEKKNAVEKIS